MFRVIVASDKFKGSLSSAGVAAAVGAGVRRVHPDATVVTIPVADGGDGTLTATTTAGFARIHLTASGPTGDPVNTAYARGADPAHHPWAATPPTRPTDVVRGTPGARRLWYSRELRYSRWVRCSWGCCGCGWRTCADWFGCGVGGPRR